MHRHPHWRDGYMGSAPFDIADLKKISKFSLTRLLFIGRSDAKFNQFSPKEPETLFFLPNIKKFQFAALTSLNMTPGTPVTSL